MDYGFILNIQQMDMGDWWELRFIDTRNKQITYIMGLGSEDLDLSPGHKLLDPEFDKYIIAQWSKADIRSFIDAGGFSDTLLVLNLKDKY